MLRSIAAFRAKLKGSADAANRDLYALVLRRPTPANAQRIIVVLRDLTVLVDDSEARRDILQRGGLLSALLGRVLWRPPVVPPAPLRSPAPPAQHPNSRPRGRRAQGAGRDARPLRPPPRRGGRFLLLRGSCASPPRGALPGASGRMRAPVPAVAPTPPAALPPCTQPA